MLNDVTCFKAVYIVCGNTDLRSGMDRLAALLEAQTGNRPYVPDTLYLFCGGAQSVSKDWYGKGMDGFCYIRDCQKAVSNGRAALRKCVP